MVRRRHIPWILLALGVLALALRGWGLAFGLPNLSRPDENTITNTAVRTIMVSFFSGQPSLNPKMFYYPGLYPYLVTLGEAVFYGLGCVAGLFSGGQAFVQAYMSDWGPFLFISRVVSVCAGVVGVWAMFLLGKTAARSRWVGVLSALLLTITYLHGRESHFGVTDTLATTITTLALWLAVSYARRPRLKTLYWASALCGVAAATKYPCGLSMVAVMAAHLVVQWRAGYPPWRLLGDDRQFGVLLMVTLCLFGPFVLINPYIFLDWPTFMEHWTYQTGTLKSHIEDMPVGWWYHLCFSLWYGLGWPYLLAALFGMAVCSLRAGRELLEFYLPQAALMAYAFVFYALMGNTHYNFVRYVLPVVPVLCFFAAWFVWMVARGVVRRYKANFLLPRYRVAAASLVLLLLIAFPGLARLLTLDHLLGQADTRSLARAYLLAHLPNNGAVGIGRVFTHVDLPYAYWKYFLDPPQHASGSASLPQYGFAATAQYTTTPVERHELRISTYADVPTLHRLGITYVVLGMAPQPFYALPQAEVDAVTAQPALKAVAHYSPYAPGAEPLPAEDYDRLDGFFLPFARFDGIVRPGPDMRIYAVQPDSAPGDAH
ncbi:MAG: glycosyltransferase family 39 protein [Candidatus Melainabacteria bacterium]